MNTKTKKVELDAIKDYGFVEPQITDDQYQVFGSFSNLPKTVVQRDGDWSPYRPAYEAQSNNNFDTHGCVTFGTENAIEYWMKKVFGLDINYSDRFIYILSGSRPPGSDPQHICEVIRDKGLIEEKLLPFVETFEEYIQPDPMPENLLEKGREWKSKFAFKHEWVFTGYKPKAERIALLKEYLKYSVLNISVTAWKKVDGVYVDDGGRNTHWCVLEKIADYKEYKDALYVFDTYDHSTKVLHPDHNVQFCKRIYVGPATETIPTSVELEESFWGRLWRFIREYLNEIWR